MCKGQDWDDEFRMKMKKKQGEVQKNELNRYLEDDVEDDHPKFDIFNWWKFKASKYYIFSCMNRYIFVIHVSYIVSSEFVFSIRDRMICVCR